MSNDRVPEFAIVGHPNEGKSSVVSTLAEDDSVKISPTPGETIECRKFPVSVDGKEIIRFIDTPGFQYPRKTLAWLNENESAGDRIIREFCKRNIDNPEFKDECKLLSPIGEGAGIIYVIDGARPVRKNDIAEMEILRLTGQPRMALLNCKDDEGDFLEGWKAELRKHFNVVRMFNAQKATYAERIDLLKSLKRIDPDWELAIEKVISAFKKDWQQRLSTVAELVCEMLETCMTHHVTEKYKEKNEAEDLKRKLISEYQEHIKKVEKRVYKDIKVLFKHNIFNLDFPEQSILKEDLFDIRTWRLLGLRPGQLALATGLAGGLIGAKLDLIAAGLSFGVFTAIGGAIGAGSVYIGGEKMAMSKVGGIKLGKYKIKIGPNRSIQFMYVLLDRALIYYSHVINWSHSRREYPKTGFYKENDKQGITSGWGDREKSICHGFFKAVQGKDELKSDAAKKELNDLLKSVFHDLSLKESKLI